MIGQKWLYCGKVVVLGESGCIPERVVVFGEMCFGKGCCIL